MGKLQMDWLRSEDLKEEKNVTTPEYHDSRYRLLVVWLAGSARRTIEDMRRLNVEHPALSAGDRFVAAEVLVREEPDEEEEEDEDDGEEGDDDNADGYSE